MNSNPITATVDFEKDGVQHGFLRLPHSRDDSAWGSIMIPICVAKNGKGPTALLTGANHGEEYEGPVALMELAQTITAAELTGRVIIIPAMNYPAFRAATRTSPIDRGNLNRTFPGKPDGTVTEKIADYFQRTLLPLADVVVDIHAGGKTLDFLPLACAHRLPDKAQEAKCIAAMEAFSAPYSMMLLEIDSVGMYDTAAEAMGKVFVSTELGGGGSSTARSNAIAKRGIRNVLIHSGILRGEMEKSRVDKARHAVRGLFHIQRARGPVRDLRGPGRSSHERFGHCQGLAGGAHRRCSRHILRENGRDRHRAPFSGADQDG